MVMDYKKRYEDITNKIIKLEMMKSSLINKGIIKEERLKGIKRNIQEYKEKQEELEYKIYKKDEERKRINLEQVKLLKDEENDKYTSEEELWELKLRIASIFTDYGQVGFSMSSVGYGERLSIRLYEYGKTLNIVLDKYTDGYYSKESNGEDYIIKGIEYSEKGLGEGVYRKVNEDRIFNSKTTNNSVTYKQGNTIYTLEKIGSIEDILKRLKGIKKILDIYRRVK